MSLENVVIEWVDSDSRLAELCCLWSELPYVAVDTEFIRTDTFYPILGLLQVSDGSTCWLVDPLAVTDLLAFAELMADTRVIKLFHSCSEDLEVLRLTLNVLPKPIIDTQVAAAFAGYGFSRGYAALVGEVLGIELDKHETRSDWLQRPLTEAQCRYGAEDVYYLVRVYQQLNDKLERLERLDWLQSDMAELLAKAGLDTHPDEYYLKIKGAWQLRSNELAILKILASWREKTARTSDRPRGRVVNDRLLWEIARCKPRNAHDLSQVPEMHPRVQRQHGDQLLQLINGVLTAGSEQWPPVLPRPLPRESGVWLKQLRAIQNRMADELGLAPEILARKRDLESILSSAYAGNPQLPENWKGRWREQLMGHEMLDALPDL